MKEQNAPARQGNGMTLILVGTQPRIIFPVLCAAHLQGHTAVVVGPQSTRNLRWSPWCAAHVLADLGDTHASGAVLGELVKTHAEATVVPCDCDGIRFLQRLQDATFLTVPMPSLTSLEVLDDKWRFWQLCEQHGLPVPRTVHADRCADLDFDQVVAAVGLPFVVKPTCESGSRGVVVVRQRADLHDKVMADEHYPPGPVIAQTYIAGCDIDADLLAVGGQVRLLATHRAHDHWTEFGRHAHLEELAHALCRITDFSGPMNIDARLEENTGRIYLVEANPRFWASVDVALAAGLDFLAASLTPPDALRTGPECVRVNRRHPLLRPRDWQRLLTSRAPEARLARALLMDPRAGVALVKEIPGMAARGLAGLTRSAIG
jgi:hypothetical protein